MRVRVTALVILEALSLAAPTARAAPASGEGPGRAHNVLRWTRTARAEGCVSAEELAAAVESRLNRKVFAGEGQPDLLIEGRSSGRRNHRLGGREFGRSTVLASTWASAS